MIQVGIFENSTRISGEQDTDPAKIADWLTSASYGGSTSVHISWVSGGVPHQSNIDRLPGQSDESFKAAVEVWFSEKMALYPPD